MPKLAALAAAMLAPAMVAGAIVPPGGAAAGVLGPHAGQCDGRHPAMLVHVIGLRDRGGTVRVRATAAIR